MTLSNLLCHGLAVALISNPAQEKATVKPWLNDYDTDIKKTDSHRGCPFSFLTSNLHFRGAALIRLAIRRHEQLRFVKRFAE